jgi:DNA (cytosine-5)-methyltransferase 1
MRFIDLFAGLGGFHYALSKLGHECVFVSELDEELRTLYETNFPSTRSSIYGDIRVSVEQVPAHDILCAGFPCQPFSKSGSQLGLQDKVRGTLFHEIIKILRVRKPTYVILENVGNFERHDGGRTWSIVQKSLIDLGYSVRGTTHVATGGHGLVSPHHLGFPQHRERFYIVASRNELPRDPFPPASRRRETSLSSVVVDNADLTEGDRNETKLSEVQESCIEHWNTFIKAIPEEIALPSFPLWGDEFGARYPFKLRTPHTTPLEHLKNLVPHRQIEGRVTRSRLLEQLPSYARTDSHTFPDWKVSFISRNRLFLQEY